MCELTSEDQFQREGCNVLMIIHLIMINYHNNESVLNAIANFYGQTILGKYNTVN